MRAPRSSGGSLALFGLAAAVLAVACGHDWDALDPRLASTTGAGGAAQSTGASIASSVSVGSGMGGESASSSASIASSAQSGGASASASASASSSGAGGSAPVHCGGTSVLSYDFTGDPTDLFSFKTSMGAVAAQTAGEAVITLPSAQVAKASTSFTSIRTYDLTADRVFVKVTGVPDVTTTAEAFVEVLLPGAITNAVSVRESMGKLTFVQTLNGSKSFVTTIPYDPVKHLYWSLRADEMGTTYWETSADGVSFDVQAMIPNAQLGFAITALKVVLGADTAGGEVNPGAAHFTDVNGGGAPKGKWCASSSFKDDFNDGVADPRWGRQFTSSAVTLNESGGTFNAVMTPNTIGDGEYFSSVSFDMTEDSILVQVAQTPNPATQAEALIRAETASNMGVLIAVSAGKVYFETQIMGTQSQLATTTVSAMTAWLRIREHMGMTYWETSPDGMTWTTHVQNADVIDMTRVDVRIGADQYVAVASPGVADFDNYNLPP